MFSYTSEKQLLELSAWVITKGAICRSYSEQYYFSIMEFFPTVNLYMINNLPKIQAFIYSRKPKKRKRITYGTSVKKSHLNHIRIIATKFATLEFIHQNLHDVNEENSLFFLPELIERQDFINHLGIFIPSIMRYDETHRVIAPYHYLLFWYMCSFKIYAPCDLYAKFVTICTRHNSHFTYETVYEVNDELDRYYEESKFKLDALYFVCMKEKDLFIPDEIKLKINLIE